MMDSTNLKLACDQQIKPEACFRYAVKVSEEGSYPLALKYFEFACELGSSEGCANLGWVQLNKLQDFSGLTTYRKYCSKGQKPSCDYLDEVVQGNLKSLGIAFALLLLVLVLAKMFVRRNRKEWLSRWWFVGIAAFCASMSADLVNSIPYLLPVFSIGPVMNWFAVSTVTGGVILIFLLATIYRKSHHPLPLLTWPVKRYFAVIPFLLVTVLWWDWEYSLWTEYFSAIPENTWSEGFVDFVLSASPLAQVMVVLFAPVFEEVVFRGYLLGLLQQRYHPTFAILLTAVLFSLAHFNPAQLFGTLLVGIACGVLAYKSRSIIPAIILHLAVNLITINLDRIDLFLVAREVSIPEYSYGYLVYPLWMPIVGSISLVVSILLLRRSRSHFGMSGLIEWTLKNDRPAA